MSFVAVRSYDNYINANIILSRLEEENISCYLQNEYTVTIDPLLTNAIGGIRLMVNEVQASRALQLLDEYEADYNKAATCPACGSMNVHYVTRHKDVKNWFTALGSWLLSSYAMVINKVYHCYDCGHEFDDLPTDESSL